MAKDQLKADRLNDYEVGLICSAKFEYDAAVAMLDENDGAPTVLAEADTNLYCLGLLGNNRVVIATPASDTNSDYPTTETVAHMNRTFPKMTLRLMVGVGGGAPTKEDDIRLGDVVVGVQRLGGYKAIFQYDYHQAMKGGGANPHVVKYDLQQAPAKLLTAVAGIEDRHGRKGHHLNTMIETMLKASPELQKKFERPSSETDVLFKATVVRQPLVCQVCCAKNLLNMEARVSRMVEDRGLKIHYGTIASSGRMMTDAKLRDKIAADTGTLCFTTEAETVANQCPVICIRGICNYSDSHEYEAWKNYAAIAAAAFAKDLLIEAGELERSVASTKDGDLASHEELPLVHAEVTPPERGTGVRPRIRSRPLSLGLDGENTKDLWSTKVVIANNVPLKNSLIESQMSTVENKIFLGILRY